MGGNANPAIWHIDNLGIALEIGITGLVLRYSLPGAGARLPSCRIRYTVFVLQRVEPWFLPASKKTSYIVTVDRDGDSGIFLNYFRDEGIRVKSFRMVLREEGAVHIHFALSGKATWLCF